MFLLYPWLVLSTILLNTVSLWADNMRWWSFKQAVANWLNWEEENKTLFFFKIPTFEVDNNKKANNWTHGDQNARAPVVLTEFHLSKKKQQTLVGDLCKAQLQHGMKGKVLEIGKNGMFNLTPPGAVIPCDHSWCNESKGEGREAAALARWQYDMQSSHSGPLAQLFHRFNPCTKP